MKNAQKKDILTRAVSTGVLTNSVFFSFLCFFKFCMFCWKHNKNWGFSQTKKTHKKNKKRPSVKNWSKLALKTGPSMLRNKIGPVLTLEMGLLFLFIFFLEKSSSFYRENEIFKTKNKKQKIWTSFLTLEKAKAYIYIYIQGVALKNRPRAFNKKFWCCPKLDPGVKSVALK